MSDKRFVLIEDNCCVTKWYEDGSHKVLLLEKYIDELQTTISTLKEENEQLRKQCFELEKDYVIETSDISDKIFLDDEINELKKKYGEKDE